MKQFQDFMVRSTKVANTLLNMSLQNDPGFDEAVRYVWEEHRDVVPTAFAIWYDIAIKMIGKPAADVAVRRVTDNIAGAPLKESSSRAVICDMLYAMQDRNATKGTQAWATVANRHDGWPVAWEVMTLMSSLFSNILTDAVQE